MTGGGYSVPAKAALLVGLGAVHGREVPGFLARLLALRGAADHSKGHGAAVAEGTSGPAPHLAESGIETVHILSGPTSSALDWCYICEQTHPACKHQGLLHWQLARYPGFLRNSPSVR